MELNNRPRSAIRILHWMVSGLFALVSHAYAVPEWASIRAFEGGHITALCSHGDSLYAGTAGAGIYSSGDEGASWKPMIKLGLYLESGFKVSGLTANSKALLGTSETGRVYRHRHGEFIWKSLMDPKFTTMGMKAETVHSDGDRMIALDPGEAYFLSEDAGETWARRDGWILPNREPIRNMVLSLNRIAAATDNKVYGSQDGGSNWNLILEGAGTPGMMVSDGTNLWIGTDLKLVRTAWASMPAEGKPIWIPVAAVGIPQSRWVLHGLVRHGEKLWVAGGDALFYSADMGATFKAIPIAGGKVPGVYAALTPTLTGAAAASASEGLLVAAAEGEAVTSNRGLYNRTVSSMALQGGRMHAVVQEQGWFTSVDSGRSWAGPLTGVKVDAKPGRLFHAFGRLYLAQGTAIYRHDEGGKPPEKLGTLPIPSPLVVALQHKGLLFAGAAAEGIYQSADSGRTWTRPNPDTGWNLDKGTLRDLASSGTTLYAVVANQFQVALYSSQDDGKSWTRMDFPSTFSGAFLSILAHGDTLFAGTTADLLKSVDAGKTWKETGLFTYSSSVVGRVAAEGDFILAASVNSGAAFSADRGLTWQALPFFAATLTSGLPMGDAFLFGSEGMSLLGYYPLGAPPESIRPFARGAESGRKHARYLRLPADAWPLAPGLSAYDARGGRMDAGSGVRAAGIYFLPKQVTP